MPWTVTFSVICDDCGEGTKYCSRDPVELADFLEKKFGWAVHNEVPGKTLCAKCILKRFKRRLDGEKGTPRERE